MSESESLPWFKMYPQEFMGDENVQLMGPTELGIYFAMLMHEWKMGSVPDNPKMVARICRGTPSQVEEAWDLIRPCFDEHPDEDGRIVNPRLEKERQDALDRRQRARKAAKKRADGAERGDGGTFEASDQPADAPAGGGADAGADAGAAGGADAPADAPAMRASNASDGQKNRDTEVTELQEVQTTDSDESALRALADLGNDPPDDEATRKQVTDALVKAWLSLQPERPPEKEIGKQGAAAKRLAESTAPRKLAIALYGLEHLWEHSEAGSPWDLFTLEKKLSKSLKKGTEVIRDGGGSKADRDLSRSVRKARQAVGVGT